MAVRVHNGYGPVTAMRVRNRYCLGLRVIGNIGATPTTKPL